MIDCEQTQAQVGCAGILVQDTFCGPMPEVPFAADAFLNSHSPVVSAGKL
jgi:hypothetical protein